MDLVFEGVPSLPRVGEEQRAKVFHLVAGGTGMQAIGAARLGLDTFLVAPMGAVGASSLVRSVLEAEGVRTRPAGRDDPEVPVTAILSGRAGTAMVTAHAGREPTPEEVRAVSPSSILLSLGRVDLAPAEAKLYAVTGALEVGAVATDLDRRLEGVHCVIANEAEARTLTGSLDAESAARSLSSATRTAVVTRGPGGAIAARRDTVERVEAPVVDLVDATGAGDLFAPAFVWAERAGAGLRRALELACLYASLSVRAPTALAGALRRADFLEEAASRGLWDQ